MISPRWFSVGPQRTAPRRSTPLPPSPRAARASLAKHPDLQHYRLLRVIVGNPVTMASMTSTVADAGSYAPVTILVAERPDGVHIAYDRVASAIAPYQSSAASAVAMDLDRKVLQLLRAAAGPDER
jgi:hypothetical protein